MAINNELLLMVFIYIFTHKNRTSLVFTGGLRMNRDETSLHPDTGVTSVMFVERSLNEIRFWSRIMKEHSFFFDWGLDARIPN